MKEEHTLDISSIQAQMSHLEGKVLTIIDASYTDGRQLEAVKGLVKKMFREQGDWIYELATGSSQRPTNVGAGSTK